jgi:membrane protein DedA with SNARE-associated domain
LLKDDAVAAAKPPAWLGYVLVGCVAGIWILGFAVDAFMPQLLKANPLLLMALKPSFRYMVAASPRIDAVAFCAVGVSRLLLSDPVYFLLGWFYGNRAIAFFEEAFGKTNIDSARRMFLRGGPLLALLFASPIVCVLAGAAKMRPRLFVTLDVIGTIVVVVLLRLFSESVEQYIEMFLRFNDRNSGWLVVLTILGALVVVVRVGARRIAAAKAFTKDVD